MIPVDLKDDPELKRIYSEGKARDFAIEKLKQGYSPLDAIRSIQYTLPLPVPLKRPEIKAIVREAMREFKAAVRSKITMDPADFRRRMVAEVKAWGQSAHFRLGIPKVDEQFGGGIYPGEIMVIYGSEGSMKTSLVLNGISDYIGRTSGVCLYFSMDMEGTKVETRRVMRMMGCDENTALYHMAKGSPEYREADERLQEADDGRFLLVEGEQTIKSMEEIIKVEIPDVVVIDYITAIDGYRSDLDCTRDVMPKIKEWARREKTAFVLLNQMSRAEKSNQRKGETGNGMGGSIVEQRADVVLSLFKDQRQDGDMPAIILTTVKNRRGLSGRSYSLEYRGYCMEFTGRAAAAFREKKQAPVFKAGSEF